MSLQSFFDTHFNEFEAINEFTIVNVFYIVERSVKARLKGIGILFHFVLKKSQDI